jgi:hypothetical protein
MTCIGIITCHKRQFEVYLRPEGSLDFKCGDELFDISPFWNEIPPAQHLDVWRQISSLLAHHRPE